MGYAMIAMAIIKTGTAIGQAVIEGGATGRALNKMIDALHAYKYYDINKLKSLGKDTDLDHFKDSLQAQQDYDPAVGGARNRGAENMLQVLNQDASGNTRADRSMVTLENEADANKVQNQQVIDSLISQAKDDLAKGATLGPEFEAELVRSGLEKSGASGDAAAGSGAVGSNLRRLLGSEGVALEQSRAANARADMGTAAGLQSARSNILSNLVEMDNNLRGAKMQRATGAVMLANSSMPSIGMSGADAVGLDMANTNTRNQVNMTIAGMKAQKSLAKGQMWSKILGSGSEALSSVMGGMLGGAGGAAGAAGGAGGAAGGAAGAAGGAASIAGSQYGGWGVLGSKMGGWVGGLFNRTPTVSYSQSAPSYYNTGAYGSGGGM